MKFTTAALAALAATPALAHTDRAVHLHGTDAVVWFAIAVAGTVTLAILMRR